jgi:hypothetical protein
MSSIRPAKKSSDGFLLNQNMDKKCSHPKVQIVAREEDAEFVECLDCREVFDSSEFKDMAIEESTPPEED